VALTRRKARPQRSPKPDMLSQLDSLIGSSATNWLIIAGAGLAFLAVAALLPALIRRLTGRDRNPLL
jgi:hypothetical protein